MNNQTQLIYDFAGENSSSASSWRYMRAYNKGFVCRAHFNVAVDINKAISIFREKYPNCHINKLLSSYSMEDDDAYMYLSDDALTIHARTEQELSKHIENVIDLFAVGKNTFCIKYAFMNGNNEISYETLILFMDKVEPVYPELYPDIDIKYLAEDFAAAREKILLLYGIPGVGKTSFIRYMVTNFIHKKNIIYVKDATILNNSKFWLEITKTTYDYLILDDINASLSPRQNNENNFISELLSYTSGILEQNASKVIITTNMEINQIDKALVRPGRCFDFITLQPLSFAQGKEIWINKFGLNEDSYDTLYGDMTEITQASLMSDKDRMLGESKVRRYIRHGAQEYSITQKLQDLGMLDSRMGFL